MSVLVTMGDYCVRSTQYCRRTYILPGCIFPSSSFFLLFCRLISKLAERNSTKTGHMLGTNCDLKTHVKNLGYASPTNRGPQNHPFWTTSQLNGNFNGLYLRNETRYKQTVKFVDNYKGLLHRSKMSWTLVYKRLQTGPPFYPQYVNSAFYVISRLRRRWSANRTQPHFAKRWTVGRANNLLYNSWGRPPGKMGAKKLLHLFGFSTTSILNGEYLMYETCHRQSGAGAGKYEGSPTLSKNFMNFGPQTA